MVAPEELYIMDVTEFTKILYRMGNARWPAFTEERARVDVVIVLSDGVEIVVANGNGFSAFDHLTPIMRKPGKRIWMIRRGAWIPDNLVLVEDLRKGHEGHFMIAPKQNMPLKQYLSLLEELGTDPVRVQMLSIGAESDVG